MPDERINLDGVDYVRADTVQPETDAEWVMVRSRDAGVFAGRLVERNGTEVELKTARRIWQWAGAATLSELAMLGTSKPSGCKFPAPVPNIIVLGVCEMIAMTEAAVASIAEVPVWSAR